ncbi:hypothetical protein K227x_19250 [Rubripirellula lacrimiformis]|uniref:Uncharacterized protein n=1 Tax=Rubripirellula lacrimiformis TaxID=1930273 RepID=A0A517N8T6_9BACT|nr:hypothetical protein K227x_19250 [Rubripirellula lacrimiformis]
MGFGGEGWGEGATRRNDCKLQIEQCKFAIGGMVGGTSATADLHFEMFNLQFAIFTPPPHPGPLPHIEREQNSHSPRGRGG